MNTCKNIIVLIGVACAIQSNMECSDEFILVNASDVKIIFKLNYAGEQRNGRGFCIKACPDEIPVGPRGAAWRIRTVESESRWSTGGDKSLSLVAILDATSKTNYKNLITSIHIDRTKDYGIFFSYENGKPTLKVYDKATTRSKGYAWEDWDTGKGH